MKRCAQLLPGLKSLLIILFPVFTIGAQDHGFFDQVWLDQGLSQSSITSIAQDRQGFIWFGTQDGLNRYDGRRIDKFNLEPFNPNSLSGDIINDICTDSNQLWVLNRMGIDLLDLHSLKATHISEHIKNHDSKGRAAYKIWIINGKIYLFTSSGFNELKKGKGNGWELIPYKVDRRFPSEQMFDIAAACSDDKNNLYIGTTEGIYQCKAGSTMFHLFAMENSGLKKDHPYNAVCSTLFYKNRRLFFSQGNVFHVYNIQTKEICSFTTNGLASGFINCSLTDNRGNIWLGTRGEGVFLISQNDRGHLVLEKHFTKGNGTNKYSLKSNAITSLFQGRHPNEDVVWIGSRDAGAFAYSYSKNSFQLVSALIDNPQTSFFGIVKDRENVIWGLTNTGLYGITRSPKKVSFIDLSSFIQKAMRPAEGIYCDNKDDVWTAMDNTLYRVDKKNNKLIKVAGPLVNEIRNHIFDITGSGEDTLLLGTGRGLVVYNKSTGKITWLNEITVNNKKIKVPTVGCVFVDSKKNWWLGTTIGLFFIDKKNKRNHVYKHDSKDRSSLLSIPVMDIQETPNGEILVATTKGLSILKKPGREHTFENHYDPAPGFKNNFIYGMIPDRQGNFWMTTNFGITVFNPEKRNFRTYDGADGTYLNEFNSNGYFAAADGELLFGGIDGLIAVYPEKLVRNMRPPNLVLRAFKINWRNSDSLLNANKMSLDLEHNQNSFYFEFSVPDFSGENNSRLMYLLEGFQTEWTDLEGADFFSFVNLSPGDYVMKVKAVNREGVESLSPFSLSIHIRTPFWESGWFYLLILALIAALIGWLYRYRLRIRIHRLKEVERIRQEENEKVRKAAALDLHDEFGNGLTRISMLVEMARMKMPKENVEMNKFLSVISENSARLYQGTKDFIWSITPGKDNLYETVIRIKDFGDELFYGTGTVFEANGIDEGLKSQHQLPGTSRNITMIFKEALSNILKHAVAGKVRLLVENNEEMIILRLKDNGKGFDISKNGNGFGLSNMRHRAAQIGARLEVHSAQNEGAEMVLIIKKQDNV